MLPDFSLNFLATETLTFYKREQTGRNSTNQPIFSWEKIDISGCLYVIDRPETEEEAQRYQSTDRLTAYIPKGYDDVDFSGWLIEKAGRVYKVEGNAVTYMAKNTPGLQNRVVYAYRRAEKPEPTMEQAGVE